VTEYERKRLAKLDAILTLLQGLTLENKGIRQHISTAQDVNEIVLKDVTKLFREDREIHLKEIAKRTRPGDSR
jgi:hypothetical protein